MGYVRAPLETPRHRSFGNTYALLYYVPTARVSRHVPTPAARDTPWPVRRLRPPCPRNKFTIKFPSYGSALLFIRLLVVNKIISILVVNNCLTNCSSSSVHTIKFRYGQSFNTKMSLLLYCKRSSRHSCCSSSK